MPWSKYLRTRRAPYSIDSWFVSWKISSRTSYRWILFTNALHEATSVDIKKHGTNVASFEKIEAPSYVPLCKRNNKLILLNCCITRVHQLKKIDGLNVLQYIVKIHGFVTVGFFFKQLMGYFRFLCKSLCDFRLWRKIIWRKKFRLKKDTCTHIIISIVKYIFYLFIIFRFVNFFSGLIKKRKKLDRTKLSIYSINK